MKPKFDKDGYLIPYEDTCLICGKLKTISWLSAGNEPYCEECAIKYVFNSPKTIIDGKRD